MKTSLFIHVNNGFYRKVKSTRTKNDQNHLKFSRFLRSLLILQCLERAEVKITFSNAPSCLSNCEVQKNLSKYM